MAPMKRKANFAKRSAMKRARTDNRVSTVLDALVNEDSLSADLRTLLKSALPIALNAFKADRHSYEVEVIGEAEKALASVQQVIEGKHQEALTTQNAMIAPTELAQRTSAKKEAEGHLEAAKAKVEGLKANKKAAEKAVQDAQNSLNAAKQEEKTARNNSQKCASKKDAAASLIANDFVALRNEGSTAAGKKAFRAVSALAKEFPANGSVFHALASACKTPPYARTQFEHGVFTTLEGLLQTRLGEYTQTAADAEAASTEKANATAAAQEVLGKAQEELKTTSDELEAANAASKEASKAVSKADNHLKHIWEDMKKVCDAQDGVAKQLKHFKEEVWGAFNQLKEKEPEPEPVEEEPAAEEPVAEEPAAEEPAAEAPAAEEPPAAADAPAEPAAEA